MNVLIVAADEDTIATVAAAAVQRLDANITVACTLAEALELTTTNLYDAMIASHALPDGNGLALLGRADGDCDAPLVLLDDVLNADRVLAALRLKVLDVLPRPYDMERLIEIIEDAVKHRRRQERDTRRTVRLQKLSNRMIRDRRELRDRIDLICRDIVQAYRRLAEKVVEASQNPAADRESV